MYSTVCIHHWFSQLGVQIHSVPWCSAFNASTTQMLQQTHCSTWMELLSISKPASVNICQILWAIHSIYHDYITQVTRPTDTAVIIICFKYLCYNIWLFRLFAIFHHPPFLFYLISCYPAVVTGLYFVCWVHVSDTLPIQQFSMDSLQVLFISSQYKFSCHPCSLSS